MRLGKEAFIVSLSLCVELVQRHHSFKIIVLYVCPLYLFWDFKVAGPFPFLRFWGCYQCSGLGWCHWCGYPAAGWHGAIRIPSSCLPQAFWYVLILYLCIVTQNPSLKNLPNSHLVMHHTLVILSSIRISKGRSRKNAERLQNGRTWVFCPPQTDPRPYGWGC